MIPTTPSRGSLKGAPLTAALIAENMVVNIKQIASRYHDFILDISEFVTVCLFFMFVVGLIFASILLIIQVAKF